MSRLKNLSRSSVRLFLYNFNPTKLNEHFQSRIDLTRACISLKQISNLCFGQSYFRAEQSGVNRIGGFVARLIAENVLRRILAVFPQSKCGFQMFKSYDLRMAARIVPRSNLKPITF